MVPRESEYLAFSLTFFKCVHLLKFNLTAMNVRLENIFLKVIAINGNTMRIQTTLHQ